MNLRHPSPLTLVAALLLVVPPLALGAHQDDAGSGGDAPHRPENALAVTPSTFTGTLSWQEGDREDWCVVDLPPDEGVAIRFQPDGDAHLEVHARAWPHRSWHAGAHGALFLDPQPAGLRLRVAGFDSD